MKSIVDRPPGWALRAGLRLPIILYELGLGWMLDDRFMLLNHRGRKSGLPYRTVVEIVRHDRRSATYYAVSGWGEKSDWYQNVRANPQVHIHVGRCRLEARAESVPLSDSLSILEAYVRDHPTTFRELSRLFLGQGLQSGPEAFQLLAQKMPMVAFRVRSQPTSQAHCIREKDTEMFKKIILYASITMDRAETTRKRAKDFSRLVAR